MSKNIFIYYSRSGSIDKVGSFLKSEYSFNTERVIDLKSRKGLFGFIFGGREALNKKETKIQSIKEDPNSFDFVLIGTPVWASHIPPAIRTYLNSYKDKIGEYGILTSQGGSGAEKVVMEIEKLMGRKSKIQISLIDKDIKEGTFKEGIKEKIGGLV